MAEDDGTHQKLVSRAGHAIYISGGCTDVKEKDNIMREYREMYISPLQSVNEFETKFKCMIKMHDARKGEDKGLRGQVAWNYSIAYSTTVKRIRSTIRTRQRRITGETNAISSATS